MKTSLIPTRLGRRIIIVTLSTRRQVDNWKIGVRDKNMISWNLDSPFRWKSWVSSWREGNSRDNCWSHSKEKGQPGQLLEGQDQREVRPWAVQCWLLICFFVLLICIILLFMHEEKSMSFLLNICTVSLWLIVEYEKLENIVPSTGGHQLVKRWKVMNT